MDEPIIADTEWQILAGHAATAARREAARWPAHVVNAGDLEGDVMESLVASPVYTRKLLDLGASSVSAVIRKATWRKAHAAAERYREFHGRYLYDTARVRALLEAGFLDTDHPATEPDEAEGVLRLNSDEASDLRAGFDLIAPIHSDALSARYRGTGTTTASKVHRAVAALAYTMNNLAEERARLAGRPSDRFGNSLQA